MIEINYSTGPLGGYKPADPKHPITGYYISLADMKYLQDRIEEAERTESEMKMALSKAIAENEEKIRSFNEQLLLMQNELMNANKRIEDEKFLNKNLIRVAKERACSSKGINSKKSATGYIVLSAQEKYIRKYGKKIVEETVWEQIIQTPFEATLPFDGVINYIREDIKSIVGHEIIKYRLRANYQKGYWEIICLQKEAPNHLL